jgi:hypothetical protein
MAKVAKFGRRVDARGGVAWRKQKRSLLWLASALSFAGCSPDEGSTAEATGSLAPRSAANDAGAHVDGHESVEDEQKDESETIPSADVDADRDVFTPDVTTSTAMRDESTGSASCAEGAADRDGDGLCDAAEARLGTDPGRPDTDGDSLSDGAEVNGILVQAAGQNGESVLLDLPAVRADPLHRDLFVEIDYYKDLAPNAEVQRMLVQAFADAPLNNPDGKTGITLHLLVDDEIAGDLALPSLGDEGVVDASPEAFPTDVWRDFRKIKDAYADPARHAAYHYAVFAQTIRNSTGTGVSFHINGHDFAVTLGHAEHPSDLMVAGTFMHELGHNLGLHHGGKRHIDLAPNYLSVMNYLYQNKGLVRKVKGKPKTNGKVVYHEQDEPLEPGYEAFIDYSRFRLQEISEWTYAESTGLSPLRASERAILAEYGIRRCMARGAVWYDPTRGVDYDLDGDISSEVFDRDLNCDGGGEIFPESQNDWEVLKFDGAGSIGDADSWEQYRAGTYAAVTYGPCEPPLESLEEP